MASTHTETDASGHAHIMPKLTYYLIFAMLIGLTALTVVVAWIDLGHLNPLVALVIATIKATLVVLFFMHMRFSERIVWVSFIGALVFVGLLLGGSLDDELTRRTATYLPEPLLGQGEPVMGLDGASQTH